MTEVKDLSGNGGRSDPTFTNDRSGRPEAPLVVDNSGTGNTTEQTIANNQTNGSQKTQLVNGNSSAVTVRSANTALALTDTALATIAATQNYDAGSSGYVGTVGNSGGTYVITKGGASIATGQVAVGTSATLIVNARQGRQKITLTPTTSTVYYIGGPSVSATTGLFVAAGAAITLDTSSSVYAVGASALTITYIEYFG